MRGSVVILNIIPAVMRDVMNPSSRKSGTVHHAPPLPMTTFTFKVGLAMHRAMWISLQMNHKTDKKVMMLHNEWYLIEWKNLTSTTSEMLKEELLPSVTQRQQQLRHSGESAALCFSWCECESFPLLLILTSCLRVTFKRHTGQKEQITEWVFMADLTTAGMRATSPFTWSAFTWRS